MTKSEKWNELKNLVLIFGFCVTATKFRTRTKLFDHFLTINQSKHRIHVVVLRFTIFFFFGQSVIALESLKLLAKNNFQQLKKTLQPTYDIKLFWKKKKKLNFNCYSLPTFIFCVNFLKFLCLTNWTELDFLCPTNYFYMQRTSCNRSWTKTAGK